MMKNHMTAEVMTEYTNANLQYRELFLISNQSTRYSMS